MNASYGSEDPLIVGAITEFNPQEVLWPERKILVGNGKIRAISVPCTVHEKSAGMLAGSIYVPILMEFGLESYQLSGSPTVALTNRLEGHPTFGKIPDGSLTPDFSLIGNRQTPTVILEVAVHNESLLDLMIEGRAWIDDPLVQYVFLLKIWPPTATLPTRLRLIVLEQSIFRSESMLYDPSPGLMCEFPQIQADKVSSRVLAELFHVNIIYDKFIQVGDEVSSRDLKCYLDPMRLFADALDFDVTQCQLLTVDFKKLIEYILNAPEEHFHINMPE